ncbi:MAG: (deoxy)nucleoside triphosphate pyrophosphohydrolase [Spirochaetota bacterium]
MSSIDVVAAVIARNLDHREAGVRSRRDRDAPAGTTDGVAPGAPVGATARNAPAGGVRPARILIARRRREKPQGGLWEFPGGKVEPGESHRQALLREIREELCCGIVPGDFIATGTHTYADVRVHIHAYHATLTGEIRCSTDHDEVAWVWPAQLPHYDLAPADRFLIPVLCYPDGALDYGPGRRKQ